MHCRTACWWTDASLVKRHRPHHSVVFKPMPVRRCGTGSTCSQTTRRSQSAVARPARPARSLCRLCRLRAVATTVMTSSAALMPATTTPSRTWLRSTSMIQVESQKDSFFLVIQWEAAGRWVPTRHLNARRRPTGRRDPPRPHPRPHWRSSCRPFISRSSLFPGRRMCHLPVYLTRHPRAATRAPPRRRRLVMVSASIGDVTVATRPPLSSRTLTRLPSSNWSDSAASESRFCSVGKTPIVDKRSTTSCRAPTRHQTTTRSPVPICSGTSRSVCRPSTTHRQWVRDQPRAGRWLPGSALCCLDTTHKHSSSSSRPCHVTAKSHLSTSRWVQSHPVASRRSVATRRRQLTLTAALPLALGVQTLRVPPSPPRKSMGRRRSRPNPARLAAEVVVMLPVLPAQQVRPRPLVSTSTPRNVSTAARSLTAAKSIRRARTWSRTWDHTLVRTNTALSYVHSFIHSFIAQTP